jgi:hypothetical protein
MFWCAALAALNVTGYLRHLDTGDQAGFALGTFFLVAWFLPIAAVLLLVGSIGGSPSAPPRPGLLRGLEMAALVAGAGLFLAYGMWMIRTFWPSGTTHPGYRSDGGCIAAILAFSLNALACAFAIRPGSASGRRPWLAGVTLAVAAIVILEMSAFLTSGITGGMLALHIPFVVGPTLVWIAALLWSARRVLLRVTVR